VCGYKLPAGLKQCAELPGPLFTPSTKADAGHDRNISVAEAERLIGADNTRKIKNYSLQIYAAAREHARARGILIADTKFEFGIRHGEILLIDEVLTPDSSRFWPADRYEPGHDQPSFDKQIVRNYLETLDWNKSYPGPELPEAIVERTRAAYEEILQRLTG
jgi:phosphoribosylaminoimidazole-succinocarboxamide synthase